MKVKFLIVGCVVPTVLGLLGCTNSDSQNDHAQLDQFATLFDRTFETPEGRVEGDIRDTRTRINSPDLDGYWFYTQLNTSPDNKLYRQRIANISLSEDGRVIVQRTFGLKSPEDFVDAWEQPETLSQLSPLDFEAYFNEGCDQVWTPEGDRSWSGYVDPDTCKIFSERRNVEILIESEGWLGPDAYKTTERGYSLDKEQIWGSKKGELITMYPVE